MKNIDELYNKTEKSNLNYSNLIAGMILEDFQKKMDFNFKGLSNLDILVQLKDYILKTGFNIEYFYSLLKEYEYDFRWDIIEAIDSISTNFIVQYPAEEIDTYTNSPYINRIIYKNSKFKIYSEFGLFEFIPANLWVKIPQIIQYIRFFNIANNCHENVEVLSRFLPDYYSITATMPNYFNKDFYHSYTLRESIVIDLTFNAVMKKDQYYQLYKPTEIFVLKNEDFLLESKKSSSINSDFIDVKMLKMALNHKLNSYKK